MELKRIIKLRTSQGLAKKIDFPEDYNELIEKTQSFIRIDQTKQFQFIDEKVEKEIRNQKDFESMSKNYEKEKTTKILVNIIDKEETIEEMPILSNVFSKNMLNEESINLSIFPNEEKADIEAEDKIKNDIKELVKKKMKDLENNIVQDIYRTIKSQLELQGEKNNTFDLNQDELIHKGIKCNECNIEDIKGIRYKCLQCQNYNLCKDCESDSNHDINHILIKIRKPLKEEDELLMQINRELEYKNDKYNYSVNTKELQFEMGKKEKDLLMKQITLKNIGEEPWKPGTVFKCLPDSKLKGNDFRLGCKVNKSQTVNIEIIFDNFKDSIINSVNEYPVYYQMFNSNNEAFGDITKFKVVFQN